MAAPTRGLEPLARRAAEAHAAAGAPWDQAVHHTVRGLIDQLAAESGLPRPGLPRLHVPAAERAISEASDLTVHAIGEVHQQLMDTSSRDRSGAWYTPTELAAEISRLGLQAQLAALGPGPDEIWRVAVIDPACGAGVLLVEAARTLARELLARLTGQTDPPPALLAAALPDVIEQCIYGMDIDPVAVDLTRTALWVEAGGTPPFSWLDRHITQGSVLDSPEAGPPAWRDRYSLATAP